MYQMLLEQACSLESMARLPIAKVAPSNYVYLTQPSHDMDGHAGGAGYAECNPERLRKS